jgi:hypothetical protein
MTIQVDWLREGEAIDDGIGSTAVRVARVWTASPTVALTAENLPQYGDSHPDNPYLLRTSMAATREPAIEACIVIVNYGISIVGGGGDTASEEVPFDTANLIGLMAPDVVNEEIATTYPILRPTMVAPVSLLPDEPPGTGSRLAWSPEDGVGLRVHTVHTVRTSFRMTRLNTLQEALGAFATVGPRSAKIHIINGIPYLFRIRLINPSTQGDESGSMAWNAEFSWIADSGVRLPTSSLPDDWVFFPNSNAVGDDTIRLPALQSVFNPGVFYLIPPFHDVFHGPLQVEDASLLEPEFIARLIYEIDANGYQGLPGVAT